MIKEETKIITARRTVIEQLTAKLMAATAIVNSEIGQDMSFNELSIGFSVAQRVLQDIMVKDEQEYRSNDNTEKDS